MKPGYKDKAWKKDRDELASALLVEIGAFADSETAKAGLGKTLVNLSRLPVEAPAEALVARVKALKYSARQKPTRVLLSFGRLAAASVLLFILALALLNPPSGPMTPNPSWNVPKFASLCIAGSEPVEVDTQHPMRFDKDAIVSFRQNEIALFAGSTLRFDNNGLRIDGEAALKTSEPIEVSLSKYRMALVCGTSVHVGPRIATVIEGTAVVLHLRDSITIDASESPREVLFLEKPIVMRAEAKNLTALGSRLDSVGISTRLDGAGMRMITVTHYEKKTRMGKAELVSRMEGYIGNGTVAFKLKMGTVGLKKGDNVANWRVEEIADGSITLASESDKVVLPLKHN